MTTKYKHSYSPNPFICQVLFWFWAPGTHLQCFVLGFLTPPAFGKNNLFFYNPLPEKNLYSRTYRNKPSTTHTPTQTRRQSSQASNATPTCNTIHNFSHNTLTHVSFRYRDFLKRCYNARLYSLIMTDLFVLL